MTKLKEYKKEIPQLKQIKRGLKEKCHSYKQCINDIKSGMLGSDCLSVHQSFIENIQSLIQKVAQISDYIKKPKEK